MAEERDKSKLTRAKATLIGLAIGAPVASVVVIGWVWVLRSLDMPVHALRGWTSMAALAFVLCLTIEEAVARWLLRERAQREKEHGRS